VTSTQCDSQLFREFDFVIGGEARRRIAVAGMVVQSNLERDGLLRLEETLALRGKTRIRILSQVRIESACADR